MILLYFSYFYQDCSRVSFLPFDASLKIIFKLLRQRNNSFWRRLSLSSPAFITASVHSMAIVFRPSGNLVEFDLFAVLPDGTKMVTFEGQG